MEHMRFAALHPSLDLAADIETRYGHVAVAKLEKQTSIVEDGRISATFPDPRNRALEGAFFHSQAIAPKNLLLFGGLYDGLVAELLQYPVERLESVLEDKAAFDVIKPHLEAEFRDALEDERFVLDFADGRDYVNRLEQKPRYDLVLVLVSDPASARHNRFFTSEFYETVYSLLHEEGVLCTRVGGASNYLGRQVKSYSGSVYYTLGSVFPHVIAVPGDDHTFCAAKHPGVVSSDADILMERYFRNLPQDAEPLPNSAFYTLLEGNRVAFLKDRLEGEPGSINSDITPVTFYLNMVLWGKFTAAGMGEFLELLRRMGPWPYLAPPFVFLLLHLFAAIGGSGSQGARDEWQRRAAVFSLTVLGFAAMALQILLLFAFQTKVGVVYGRIAVFNGLFMTGLALGAALGLRLSKAEPRQAFNLAAILFLLIAFAIALPGIIAMLADVAAGQVEIMFYALSALVGFLAGAAFPLAVELTHGVRRDTMRTSSLAEAGDHLGGAVGGLVTGGILVPILGMEVSAQLVAAVLASVLPTLFLIGKVPFGNAFFHLRNRASFPEYLPVLALWFFLGSMALIGWLARESAPGPQVQFEVGMLKEVSGSQRFEFRSEPYAAYIGGDPVTGKRTLSLSTMTVAVQVRGYAGPVNILVAVDDNGVLNGVKYIDSNETPSYILGLQGWLDGLAGRNPARKPLGLGDLDGLSGATVTSRAALASINLAVRNGLQEFFNRTWPQPEGAGEGGSTLATPKVVVALVMVFLFFPAYLKGGRLGRNLYQLGSLLLLGFSFNLLLTEVDLANLGLGNHSTWEANPAWWILALAAVVITIFFGQAYCGMICPFGVLQELVSRLGKWFGWALRPDSEIERLGRYWKFVLLTMVLAAVWLTGDGVWVSFNPMQQFFNFKMDGVLWAIAGVALLGALGYFRFWCRYWCPLGAFFALGNKLALWDRFAVTRRFGSCDLGVEHHFDIDCIRCDRCVTELDRVDDPVNTKRLDTRLFLLLMALMAALVVWYIDGALEKQDEEVGGWRKVDIRKVKSQIGSGRLNSYEAQWWRTATEDEKVDAK